VSSDNDSPARRKLRPDVIRAQLLQLVVENAVITSPRRDGVILEFTLTNRMVNDLDPE
jgi:hypothetical protein